MLEERNINEEQSESSDNQALDYHQYYARPPLSNGQKIAAAVLAFFAFFVIVIWIIQFRQSIHSPLGGNGESPDNLAADTEESEAVDTVKDTDGDGLTDYDELNTYKTSPYLEDSDSDGFGDKVEIGSGKDPNCPAGAICSPITTGEETPESVPTNDAEMLKALSNTNQTVNQPSALSLPSAGNESLSLPVTDNTADLQKVLSGKVDAKSLRQMLMSSGMDQKMLDQISDDALMASYKETLAK